MDDEERRFVREVVAGMRETPPGWVDPDDRRGKEHLTREDLIRPDARGVEPEAKILRRELDRIFRVRRDGDQVPVEESTFLRLRDAIKTRAFPARRTQTRGERIRGVQSAAKEFLDLGLSSKDVGHRLRRRDTPHQLTRWLLALKLGVSSRRLRILRKP
jgi:hypothetical protein